MATTNIELDIENITGVADADDQFIKTAQKFVVSSIPKDLMLWAGTSTSTGSHGGDSSPAAITLPQPTDNIIDVQRNGFSAEEVSESMQGFLGTSVSVNGVSVESLHEPTETFPKYYIQAGNKVVVKPVPSDSETALVNYVDFLKIDDDCDLRCAVVAHASSSEFSKLATDLVPTWTSPSIPAGPGSPDFGNDLTISSVAPAVPSAPSFTYTPASVSDIIQPLISISDMASLSATAPAYTKPTFALPVQGFDMAQFETFLETEEDIELAQGQLGRLSHELGEYQANIGVQTSKYQNDIQNELNEFNKENIVYQEDVQRKAQNFQKEIQQAIQNIQSDISTNSTNLQKDIQIALQNAVQDFQQDVQEYDAKIKRYGSQLNQYQQDVGKEVQKYSNTLTKKTQEYQGKLSLYSSQLQSYQSEVSEISQKHASLQQHINYYSQKADKYFEMAVLEINMYTQNNSKIINRTIAAQTAQQQRA